MSLNVRAARRSDQAAVKALLKTVRQDDPGRVRDWAWLLEAEGALLGAGYLAPVNTVHPHRMTIKLCLTGAASLSGEAALLLAHLQTAYPAGTPWRVQVLEHQQAVRTFLGAQGFTLVRRTWTPEVPLSAFPADWGRAEWSQVGALGYTIQGERVITPEFRAELTLAHLEHYRATHTVNPPGNLPLSKWENIFLDDLDAIWTARRSGRLAAFASLRGGGEVYWFGTLPEFDHDAEMLNAALKYSEVAQAREEGLPSLNFELDSTSPESLAVLRRLPAEPGEALLTYQT
ncbi:hypothetical protein [Deinococcus sp.]|uniref:hypothetical protein n=1 Tax=Deinococcus sp. TaxID=47478 RepID=UPI0025EDB758|nr:hypothetical protein [Deinococcus sp.]